MYISSIKFSIWCDFIERQFLEEDFSTLISDKVINGATSNPAIFNNAFLNSSAYKKDIAKLKDSKPKEIYESLALKDIKSAGKKLLPLYEKGDDGFVSIEVDPFLANDAKATIEEGRRLYNALDLPNVMIKIPATASGYEAMRALMSDGINVNATLVFSPKQAQECFDALNEGLKSFKHTYSSKANEPKAVISVFVSRFDRKLNGALRSKDLPQNMLGIMNAIKIYKQIEKEENNNIRCLFASTGVKGDDLEQEYYVEKLLFPNSINTAPLNTIFSFVASGKTSVEDLPSDEEIDLFFQKIQDASTDMEEVYKQLMDEGMTAFEKAFEQILQSLK
ncbi:MAG: transaldolase [Proteobacteria bacterium]|nr:MAG: transaldolase [Pseudomonadota bacterium]